MTRIMHSAAEVVPMLLLLKKKSGTPTSAADPKHTSCRFVRPNSILLLIFVRSFGTVTYAKIDTSFNALRTGFLQGCRS